MQKKLTGAKEDPVTVAIESQTAKVPSSGYLAAAVASMAVSATLKAFGKNHAALFVGQWAPAFLIMGIYNKLVKQHGSDATSRNGGRFREEGLSREESTPSMRTAVAGDAQGL
jgi:hypothetical protein